MNNDLTYIKSFVKLVEENQTPNMVVAEIGVFDGDTTKEYAPIVKKNNGKIYAIDWFRGNVGVNMGRHRYNEEQEGNNVKNFLTNTFPYADIIKIFHGKSHDMIMQIPDYFLDICFIDADHIYENVYKDIELCKKKVKKGGILCGHDCEDIRFANNFDKSFLEKDCVNDIHYGVIQAVYDHFGYDIESMSDHTTPSIWIKRM